MFCWTWFPFIVILGYVPVCLFYPLHLRLLCSFSVSLSHLASIMICLQTMCPLLCLNTQFIHYFFFDHRHSFPL
jgi:hypothetical protein